MQQSGEECAGGSQRLLHHITTGTVGLETLMTEISAEARVVSCKETAVAWSNQNHPFSYQVFGPAHPRKVSGKGKKE